MKSTPEKRRIVRNYPSKPRQAFERQTGLGTASTRLDMRGVPLSKLLLVF